MILTPFYRTLVSDNPIQHQGVTSNYTDYNLFSLRCWVGLWIKGKFGYHVDIDHREIEKDKKLYIQLVITHNGEVLNLTPEYSNFIQDNINDLSENIINWVPVYSSEYETYTEDGVKLPSIWVKQLLNFINLHDSYNPYVSEYGLLVNLSRVIDYKSLLSKLTLEIKNKLIELYKEGVIYKPSNDLIEKWNLIEYNNSLLYKPNWDSNVLIYPYKYKTDFLISRNSNNVIYYPLKLNMYDKHLISELLYKNGLQIGDFLFDNTGIQIELNNYKDAMIIYRLIYNYYNNRKSNIDIDIGIIYIKNLNEIKNYSIVYKIDDTERPYVLSIIN